MTGEENPHQLYSHTPDSTHQAKHSARYSQTLIFLRILRHYILCSVSVRYTIYGMHPLLRRDGQNAGTLVLLYQTTLFSILGYVTDVMQVTLFCYHYRYTISCTYFPFCFCSVYCISYVYTKVYTLYNKT